MRARSETVRGAMEALGRQALHAWKLSFPHPRTDKELSFEAPIPPEFDAAAALLRKPPSGLHKR